MVYQHAIAAVGYIERDVFVRLLGTGAAIAVPGLHRLAITNQRSKTLAQPVHRFAHPQIQALKHVVTPAVGVLHIAVVFQLAAGNTFTVTQEIQRPELAFGDAHAQVAAFQLSKLSGVVHLNLYVLLHVQRVMRTVVQRALEVFHAHPHHPFLRREKAQSKQRSIELPGAFTHIAWRNVDHHFVSLLLHLKHLDRVNHIQAGLNQPVSVANFHILFLSSVILSS